jgi:hypothetical protein
MQASPIRRTANMAMALLGAAMHNTIQRQVEGGKIAQLTVDDRPTHYTRKSKRTKSHAVRPAGTKLKRKVIRGTCGIHHTSDVDAWHLYSKPSRIGRRLGV